MNCLKPSIVMSATTRIENNCNHLLSTLGRWAVCCLVGKGCVQGSAVVLSMQCAKQDTLFRTKWERRGALPPSLWLSDLLKMGRERESKQREEWRQGEAIYLAIPLLHPTTSTATQVGQRSWRWEWLNPAANTTVSESNLSPLSTIIFHPMCTGIYTLRCM